MSRNVPTLAAIFFAVPAFAQTLPATAPAPAPTLRVAWRYAMPAATDAAVSTNGTLAILGDRAGHLVAVNLADGKALWKTKIGDSAISSPAAMGPTLTYVGDEEGTLHAVNLADGKQVWSFKTGGRIAGRPTLATNRILCGSYDNTLYCLDAASGKELWRFQCGAQVHASVLVQSDQVITGGCDAQLRALSLDAGKPLWSFDAHSPIAVTPVSQGNTLLLANMAGSAFAVDASSGKEIWSTSLSPDPTPVTMPLAMVADTCTAVDDRGNLTLLNAKTGHPNTRIRLVGKSALTPFGPHLLIAGDDGKLLLLDPATGQTVRKATLGGTLQTATASKDQILVNSSEGTLWSVTVGW